MSRGSILPQQAPGVDATEMLARKRLEVELFGVNRQLRMFAGIRERFLAEGKDPSESYRQLQAQRGRLVAALKQSRSEQGPTRSADFQLPAPRLDRPLPTRPISPAAFDPRLGAFRFGSSGVVQMAPAEEGTNVVPQGSFPHTGEIFTIPGDSPGNVAFGGELTVGPEESPPSGYDPSPGYVWLRNWKYLIPFPPPPSLSRLTYSFEAYAFVGLSHVNAEGEVLSFVSLGETPQLMTGTNVTVDIDGGWPLMADLAQPVLFYNGNYGYVTGQVTVQRSLMVGAGHVPGVAIVVGVAVALSMMSEVVLLFPGVGYSGIGIYSQDLIGRVAYSYEPQLVAEQAE
jgi:hypothetical protein